MTGGYAVILGLVGRNFAAGMSGGLAYVLDQEQMFHSRCNTDMVDIEPVSAEADRVWLHNILQDFVLKTGSTLAQSLLDDWPQALQLFHKVLLQPILCLLRHHQMFFDCHSIPWNLVTFVWHGGSMVGRRLRDWKVAGSTPGLCTTT